MTRYHENQQMGSATRSPNKEIDPMPSIWVPDRGGFQTMMANWGPAQMGCVSRQSSYRTIILKVMSVCHRRIRWIILPFSSTQIWLARMSRGRKGARRADLLHSKAKPSDRQVIKALNKALCTGQPCALASLRPTAIRPLNYIGLRTLGSSMVPYLSF